MCYVIRGFKDQSETSTTYISKRTNILKINIEKNMIRMLF